MTRANRSPSTRAVHPVLPRRERAHLAFLLITLPSFHLRETGRARGRWNERGRERFREI